MQATSILLGLVVVMTAMNSNNVNGFLLPPEVQQLLQIINQSPVSNIPAHQSPFQNQANLFGGASLYNEPMPAGPVGEQFSNQAGQQFNQAGFQLKQAGSNLIQRFQRMFGNLMWTNPTLFHRLVKTFVGMMAEYYDGMFGY